MQRAAEFYALADDDTRRQLNLAFIAIIEVDTDEEHAVLSSPWREISNAAVHVRQRPRRSAPSRRHNRPSPTEAGNKEP